jgi:hypothetical protein
MVSTEDYLKWGQMSTKEEAAQHAFDAGYEQAVEAIVNWLRQPPETDPKGRDIPTQIEARFGRRAR